MLQFSAILDDSLGVERYYVVCVCLCVRYSIYTSPLQNGLTCPTCKKVYGIKTGDMPDGTMSVREMRSSLPSHEDCGTVEIVYHFSPGVHVCL